MTIITDFPFDHCESCTECVLRTEKNNVTFAPVVRVSCENASLCLRLEKMKDAKKTQSDNGN